MTAFITRRGGTGTGLNLEIVGGTAQPENPKENTIWVNTDTEISGWCFSAEAPTSPAAGLVWIETGTADQAKINVLKENAIELELTEAKQYIGGAWVNKKASLYSGGQWTSLWSGWLFQNLLWYSGYVHRHGGSASCNLSTTGYYMYTSTVNDSYCYYGIKINLTGMNFLKARFTGAGGSYVGMFVSAGSSPNYLALYNGSGTAAWKRGCTNGDNLLNVASLSGEYYVWFGVYGNETLSYATATYLGVY